MPSPEQSGAPTSRFSSSSFPRGRLLSLYLIRSSSAGACNRPHRHRGSSTGFVARRFFGLRCSRRYASLYYAWSAHRLDALTWGISAALSQPTRCFR
jgi:hypothetical protein